MFAQLQSLKIHETRSKSERRGLLTRCLPVVLIVVLIEWMNPSVFIHSPAKWMVPAWLFQVVLLGTD
jgi:hypothetical protein